MTNQTNYTELSKKLFAEWKNSSGTVDCILHKKPTTLTIDHKNSVFVEDGVVCPEKWFFQKVRPLFLLKEAYNGNDDWNLITDTITNENKKIRKIWKRISEWTKGILNTTSDQIAPYTSNAHDIEKYNNEYLRSIAVINVKKSNGKGESDFDEINAYARFDKQRLIKQLELCNPTVIICGYTASSIDEIFDIKMRSDHNDNLYYYITLNGKSVLVIDYWHPSNQYPDIMNYYGLMNAYHLALRDAKNK